MQWILDGIKRDDLKKFSSTLNRRVVEHSCGGRTLITSGSSCEGVATTENGEEFLVTRIKHTNEFVTM